MYRNSIVRVIALAIFLLPGIASVQAADLTWDPGGGGSSDGGGTWLATGEWWDGGANVDWNNATPDNAIIGNGGGGGTITLGAVTAGSVTIDNFTGTYSLSGGTLTHSGTILIGASAATANIQGGIVLDGSGGITINGVYLSLNGAGALTYTGPTIVNNGGGFQTVNGSSPHIINSNIQLNDGMFDRYYDATITRELGTGAGQLQVLGGQSGFSGNRHLDVTISNSVSYEVVWGSAYFQPAALVLMGPRANVYGTTEFKNPLDLNGANRTIAVTKDNGGDLRGYGALDGVVRNSDAGNPAGLIKTGPGQLRLTKANTFDGPVEVQEGMLTLTTINNVASANPLGQSSASAANLLLANDTILRYTGGAASSDRSFTINGTVAGDSATIDASGSGALTLSATGSPAYGTANQARTLILGGTSTADNTLAANMADNGTGPVSVTKTNSGTWVLTGNSSLGGDVTGSGGTLTLSGDNSFSNTIVNSGALVLSGANASTGTHTVYDGYLFAASTASLPGWNVAGKVVFEGGTVAVPVGGSGFSTAEIDTLLSSATKNSGAIGFDTSSGDLTQWRDFSAAWLGPLGISKLGANMLTLDRANPNTYPSLNIYEGTVDVAANVAISNLVIKGPNATVSGSGNMNFPAGGVIANEFVFPYGDRQVDVSSISCGISGSPDVHIAKSNYKVEATNTNGVNVLRFEPSANSTQTLGDIEFNHPGGSQEALVILAGASSNNTVGSVYKVAAHSYIQNIMMEGPGKWTINGDIGKTTDTNPIYWWINGGTLIVNGSCVAKPHLKYVQNGRLGGNLTYGSTSANTPSTGLQIKGGGILSPGDGGIGTMSFSWGATDAVRSFQFADNSIVEYDVGVTTNDLIEVAYVPGSTFNLDLDNFVLKIQDAAVGASVTNRNMPVFTYDANVTVDTSGFDNAAANFDCSALVYWRTNSLSLTDDTAGTIYLSGLWKPPIHNRAVSDVTASTASLNGTFLNSSTGWAVYVHWGETDGTNNPAAWTNSAYVGTWTNVPATNISHAVGSLSSPQTYYYTFSASNDTEVIWATPSISFPTLAPPEVNNSSGGVAVTETSSTLWGEMVSGGQADAWICWGDNDGGTVATGSWDTVVPIGTIDEDSPFSTLASDLATNKTYYYRCYVLNGIGSDWSDNAETFSGTPVSTGDVGGDVELGWSYTNWTGDADSGITNDYTYTAAHCFGNNHASVTVNGVTFTEGFVSSGTGWSIGGGLSEWGGDDNAVITGSSEDLAEEFYYNGNPRTVTISGLTPGNTYKTTFYSVAWEDGSRTQTFSASGGTSSNINQDAYGNNNGIAISYTFDAAGTSQDYTITPDGGTLHMYALSNYEVPSAGGIANLAPTNILPDSASLSASVSVARNTNYTVYVHFGESDGGTNSGWNSDNILVGIYSNAASTSQTFSVSYEKMDLESDTLYWYTFRASNDAGNAWASPSWSFTAGAPTGVGSVFMFK